MTVFAFRICAQVVKMALSIYNNNTFYLERSFKSPKVMWSDDLVQVKIRAAEF